MEAATPILRVADVCMRFGGVVALNEMSFDVLPGEVMGLIGPNGAGKTTLFNCLSRLYVPQSGEILIAGTSIIGRGRHLVSQLGVARTFQNVALFDELTVLDNILVGAHSVGRGGFLANFFWLPEVRRNEAELLSRAREAMAFMRLDEHSAALAKDLPFPIRKRVEFARALVCNPKLLLLDEPAAGLNHEEVDVLRRQIADVRDRYRCAILLVEHHMGLVMSVSDRVVAMDFGVKIAEGTPQHVQRDPKVIQAYLGADAA